MTTRIPLRNAASRVAASFVCLLILNQVQRLESAEPRRIDFGRDILPILSDKCFHCHGPDSKQRQADLRLDLKSHVFADRDDIVIVSPGKLTKSELYRRITSDDPDELMPPPTARRSLSQTEIKLLGQWIEQGAEWSEHWAFVTPKQPLPPKTRLPSWPFNAIDQFVLARLETEGLRPSERANKHMLARRLSFDLTGLPPSPAEVEQFVTDDAPDAYERFVDRLLASPRYGEQMAVPWMDAARYADTDGYQNDRTRYMWVWRDWLIQALNQNKPFDEFTIEQLAGDMLPNATLFQQIASGFCRNHRINSEGGSIPAEWQVEYVVDRVDTLGTVWLGLTIGCTRCHEHKYDPISHKEYYRLYSYFNNVAEWGLGPNNGNSPPFITVPKNWPNLSPEENRAITPPAYKLKTTQTSVVRPQPGGPKTVMVMHELKQGRRATYRLERGQYNHPDKSEVLTPGVPASLNRASTVQPTNRLELAKWLVAPSNPLTARVIVNRYWQQFFGIGLVKTSENFGIQGDRPSHPKLLDWLATEFIRTDWNVKALHRLIVTSATYRQSSRMSPSLRERDPENRLMARGPRLRLPAHAIRDQALQLSNLLVEEIGGPSVRPYMPPAIWKSISNNKYVQNHGAKLYRRSLYTYWRRTVPPPTMISFNAAEREVCIVRKDRTTTPLQALTLMNNVVFVEASRFMAERILNEGGGGVDSQLLFAFRLMVARSPDAAEARLIRQAYDTFREHFEQNRQAASQLLSVGEKPRDQKLNVVEMATMTMVASTILNLDETVHKE